MSGDGFVKALIAQYLVITVAYAYQHAWWKVLYFLSATGISVAVLKMR